MPKDFKQEFHLDIWTTGFNGSFPANYRNIWFNLSTNCNCRPIGLRFDRKVWDDIT